VVLFVVFNVWIVPGFILILAVNFSIAISLLLPLELVCSQVRILTSFLFTVVTSDRE